MYILNKKNKLVELYSNFFHTVPNLKTHTNVKPIFFIDMNDYYNIRLPLMNNANCHNWLHFIYEYLQMLALSSTCSFLLLLRHEIVIYRVIKS